MPIAHNGKTHKSLKDFRREHNIGRKKLRSILKKNKINKPAQISFEIYTKAGKKKQTMRPVDAQFEQLLKPYLQP